MLLVHRCLTPRPAVDHDCRQFTFYSTVINGESNDFSSMTITLEFVVKLIRHFIVHIILLLLADDDYHKKCTSNTFKF